MTDASASVTFDEVRAARHRIYACISEEMRRLGADPQTAAQEAITRGGLEFLARWVRPEIPPPPALPVLFGMQWVEIGPERVVLRLEPAEWMFTFLGAVHGGITATALDTVLGSALHTTLPAGTAYATSDLQIRYLRALTPDAGSVMASATVVHAGRRYATAEGRVEVEATGKLIATGTAGFAMLRGG